MEVMVGLNLVEFMIAPNSVEDMYDRAKCRRQHIAIVLISCPRASIEKLE